MAKSRHRYEFEFATNSRCKLGYLNQAFKTQRNNLNLDAYPYIVEF